jgi:hypothetical protein
MANLSLPMAMKEARLRSSSSVKARAQIQRSLFVYVLFSKRDKIVDKEVAVNPAQFPDSLGAFASWQGSAAMKVAVIWEGAEAEGS